MNRKDGLRSCSPRLDVNGLSAEGALGYATSTKAHAARVHARRQFGPRPQANISSGPRLQRLEKSRRDNRAVGRTMKIRISPHFRLARAGGSWMFTAIPPEASRPEGEETRSAHDCATTERPKRIRARASPAENAKQHPRMRSGPGRARRLKQRRGLARQLETWNAPSRMPRIPKANVRGWLRLRPSQISGSF